tara:strand:- start:118 stop:420 length:303 start_codon:yes stop_codon:yes gene_type:complete
VHGASAQSDEWQPSNESWSWESTPEQLDQHTLVQSGVHDPVMMEVVGCASAVAMSRQTARSELPTSPASHTAAVYGYTVVLENAFRCMVTLRGGGGGAVP